MKQSQLYLVTAALVAPVLGWPAQQQETFADDGDDTPLPVVVWHGLGDNYAAEGLQSIGDLINDVNPGTLVYYVRMDDDASRDRTASFFGNVTEQLIKVCDDFASHPILSTAPAIDALGFSQGGVFLRGYVERCNSPPIRNLITFGSPHNGISDFKGCGATDWLCKGAMALLKGNTWSDFVQSRLVPAQYYRNPVEYEQYIEHSNFLADINNERVLKNQTYKKNLASLENLILYIFENDTTVIPKESGFFEEVNGTVITPLRARKMYAEDWIGLRELDRDGGLQFRTIAGAEHMHIPDEVFETVFKEYFGPWKGETRGMAKGKADTKTGNERQRASDTIADL